MSSDNGVYVLKTRKGEGYEYRVAHLNAIDNLDYDCSTPEDIMTNARQMWRNREVFKHKVDALLAAHELADDIDLLEYGVSFIKLTDPSYPEF